MTLLRREIIRRKSFLRRIYEDWYGLLLDALPPGNDPVLEIGSGAGFFDQRLPGAITSEVFFIPGVCAVLDAQDIPFPDAALRAIVMTDVFHHIPVPSDFLKEAARVVRRGGRVAMIEPWRTGWSEFVYSRLHSEPFEPGEVEWKLPSGGPLSAANGAMPWIIFSRDRDLFQAEFPEWQVRSIDPMMPFRYLVSGGVSMRSLMPGWAYPLWSGLEAGLRPWNGSLAMFACIVLERV